MITPENIKKHEFIGLETRISNSTNSNLIGLNGTIINETKSMFEIRTKTGKKYIPKLNNIWKFSLNNQQMIVKGVDIQKRSFDRLGGKQ